MIITLILAFGGYWLSRQGAVMRRHRAVEMLGAVSVIATDKTGTLTENKMRATKFWPATHSTRLLTVGRSATTSQSMALPPPVTRSIGRWSRRRKPVVSTWKPFARRTRWSTSTASIRRASECR